MKKQGMRRLAGFLAIWLAAQSIFTGSAYAQTRYTEEIAVSENTVTQEMAISGNAVSDEAEKESEAEADRQAENEQTVSENKAEEGKAETLLNYLYVESESISAPGVQHFMVGIGDGTYPVSSAALTLTNLYTGNELCVPSADISDDTVLFEQPFDDATEKSIYQVTGLTYEINGKQYTIQLDEIGIRSYFGVNEVVSLGNEEIDASDIQADIVTVDGMNVTTTVDQIGEALADAEGVPQGISTFSLAPMKAKGNVTVVLDPGHDSTHAGASGNGFREETLNLKIALYCKEELETYDGVTVYMTRSTEACPAPGTTSVQDNAKRVEYARNVGADAYVSIHLNSSTTNTANGACVFYPNANYNAAVGSAGKSLASVIQAKLVALGLKNNGIQIRNSGDGTKYPNGSLADYYGVIKNSKLYGFPGIIIEHAFLSNASDAANYLSSEDKLKKLGIADATGIAEYFGLEKGSANGKVGISDKNYKNGTFKMSIKGLESGLKLKFKVYPVNSPNQMILYNATEQAGVYSAVADIKYHGYVSGDYLVAAMSEDSQGKLKLIAKTTFTFEEPEFKKVSVTCKPVNSTAKKYAITADNLADAQSVSMQIWHESDKAGTIGTYPATLQGDKYVLNYAITKVKRSGKYYVYVYAKTAFNTTKCVKKTKFTVPPANTGAVKLTEQNEKKGTFTLDVSGVSAQTAIKSVSVDVWSKSDKSDLRTYTAKKTGNVYRVNGNIKYHQNNYGSYKACVRVVTKNGIETIGKNKGFKIKKPVAIVKAKLDKSKKTATVSASNVAASGGVGGVKFVVTVSGDKTKYTYQAKKSGSKYKAVIDNSEIAKAGTYKVAVYSCGVASNKYTICGETKYTIEPATIGSVTVSNKKTSQGTFQANLKGLKAPGGIAQVQFVVWMNNDKSDKVTYTAKKSGKDYIAQVNIADLGGKSGTYKARVVVISKGGIRTTGSVVKISMNDAVSVNGYSIMGDTTVTVDEMMAYYNKYATFPAYYASTDVKTLKKFCQTYIEECAAEGVRAEVAFVQAMKETGFLRYGGDVRITQFNFAGLGAVGGGASGASFPSVRIGIRAQVQHLKAYACTEPLSNPCVDGRFQYVTRGCAPVVEWLGIKENPQGKGWATDPGYGYNIVERIKEMKQL